MGDGWLAVSVARLWREAVDIVGLELRHPDGASLPPFEAGAYIDVLTPGGHLRPYSLCGPPADRQRYLIAVLWDRHGQGGSRSLHQALRVGDRLRIRAPRNEFALATTAVHSVLLAGGIGITPLLAMAHTLWARGAPFQLHYSARELARAAFAADLQQAPFAHRVHCHWSESAGRQDLAALLRLVPPASQVYACGPPGYLRSAASAFTTLGRDSRRLRMEPFGRLPQPMALGRG